MKKHRERDGLLPRMEARKRKDGFTYRYHPVGRKPTDRHRNESCVRASGNCSMQSGLAKCRWDRLRRTTASALPLSN